MNTQDANNCINALNDIKTSLTAQLRDLTRCINELEEEKERLKTLTDPEDLKAYRLRIKSINIFLDQKEEEKKESFKYVDELTDELYVWSKDYEDDEEE